MYDYQNTHVGAFIDRQLNCMFINVNTTDPFEFQGGKFPDVFPEGTGMFGWMRDTQTAFYFVNGVEYGLEFNEENFNKYAMPLIEIWEAKKAEIEAQEKYFPNHQTKAFEQLNEEFEQAKERAHIKSSLGFTVDANQTANENVNGLLVTIGDGTVFFCDYNNEFHGLNKSQLETLQKEIIQNAQNLYTQKWQYRTSIKECTGIEELAQIVDNIEFSYMEFSPQEAPTGEGDQSAGQAE